MVRAADGHGGRLPGQTFKTKRAADAYEDRFGSRSAGANTSRPNAYRPLQKRPRSGFRPRAIAAREPQPTYRVILDNWLLPKFRTERLDRIDVQTCEKFRAELFRKTGHCNTNAIIAVLGRVLEMARRHKQIRDNPTDDLPPVAAKAKEIVDG
ncbi:hypothetical protein [Candidatus Binatus sp.]|uniref:hypothetical protein n=1 Tax=Candidatus Binatus sp. TaxID=2811406 RepID=UPI003C618015